MGHALNNTLQDILIRQKRMVGFEAVWLPGVDHAGIATQNQVERSLAREDLTRHAIGRGEFIERAKQWKEKYGGVIIEQLKRLGSSCDWKRERYTMDQGLSKAVLLAFVNYYNKGLIYRGEYIVNWCPRCGSAISDLEVRHKDHLGSLFTIKYPLVENEKKSIQVATTRPETMLGDTAVAVHPKDKRYKSLIGKKVKLPLVGREIPIIADDWVDPEFGTGAVKVTPAHDPNDFEIKVRHSLESVKIINENGQMTLEAKGYEGLTREECRDKVLQDLEKDGYLIHSEDYKHSIGQCDRCDTIIEPLLSTQWFVKMESLSKPAIKVVEEGKIRFIPDRWIKHYLNWMENIRDWCISRQLWWGHRIPAWWCVRCNEGKMIKIETSKMAPRYHFFPDAVPIVSTEKPDHCPNCDGSEIIQEEDVLDTWFSSALWPFSTFGWPDTTKDLKRFYPTNALLTASGIINLWVARMIFSGLEFIQDIPFSDVYIHATVLNAEGKRMAKSLGTGVDPVILMEKYGTDALRFTLSSLETKGQSFRFWENRCEMGRNFCNKLWNAARFLFLKMNSEDSLVPRDSSTSELADMWILSRYQKTIMSATKSIESYQFSDLAKGLYEFFWHDFCDWYLELIKPRIMNAEGERQNEELHSPNSAINIPFYVLEGTLRLLHPIMPFITEEIWQMIPARARSGNKDSIMISSWPEPDSNLVNDEAETKMNLLMNIITSVRNIRSEMNIPPRKALDCHIKIKEDDFEGYLKETEDYLKTLTNVNKLTIGRKIRKPKGSASAVLSGVEVYVPLEGLIDFKAERKKIEKELEKITSEHNRLDKKLKSRDFLGKAPEEIVDSARLKKEEFGKKLQTLKRTLNSLS
jgi:valyl-tRNA synthetase